MGGLRDGEPTDGSCCRLMMAKWANWFALLCFIALSTALSTNEQLKQQALR